MVASLVARLPAVCRVLGPVVDMHKHARSMEVIARHAETEARIQARNQWMRILEVVCVVTDRFTRLLLRRRRLSTELLHVIVARSGRLFWLEVFAQRGEQGGEQ